MTTEQKFSTVRQDLLDEYRQTHRKPWVIGFSGGKDSTLVTHLVFEMMLGLSPSERVREVHVVANDTLVESPLVSQHLDQNLLLLRKAVEAFNLPIKVVKTTPRPDETFWVNLIGRGYPSPNRQFRWCTDRMKIKPTSGYISATASKTGEVIILLGVRRSESATRAGTVAKYDTGGRLHPHGDLPNCMVFRPIVELDTDEVWEFLAENNPPWGGTYRSLIKLYRDAQGGECPVVVQKSDAPSCGTSSSRFGCWTCTVVEKDRSLEGFVEAGFSEFEPMLRFRDWLVEIRNDPNYRSARRRNGVITITSGGKFVPGPFTLAARKMILERLLDLQRKVGTNLISNQELEHIRELWVTEVLINKSEPKLHVMGGADA